jgi:hypothetical protein
MDILAILTVTRYHLQSIGYTLSHFWSKNLIQLTSNGNVLLLKSYHCEQIQKADIL